MGERETNDAIDSAHDAFVCEFMSLWLYSECSYFSLFALSVYVPVKTVKYLI